MKTWSQRCLAVLGVFTMTVFPAQAAVVSVTASGQLDAFYDDESRLPFEPQLGTLYTLTFSYDGAATLDQDPRPDHGSYGQAITSMHLVIGDYATSSFQFSAISISNDFQDPYQGSNDIWSASFSSGDPWTEAHLFMLQFRDLDGTALDSDALVPIPGFPSAEFEWIGMNYLVIRNLSTVAEAYAGVDSMAVVPVPGVAWLFGLSFGVLARLRRHCRTQPAAC